MCVPKMVLIAPKVLALASDSILELLYTIGTVIYVY
jgi:hypothetical protein